MIPQSYRCTYTDISHIQKSGRTARISFVLVRFINASQDIPARLAITVSKKISKSSVVRHRIKRILMDTLYPFLQEKQGFLVNITLTKLAPEYGKLATVAERRLLRVALSEIGTQLQELK